MSFNFSDIFYHLLHFSLGLFFAIVFLALMILGTRAYEHMRKSHSKPEVDADKMQMPKE